MLDSFVANTQAYISTNPWLALVAVFVGGIITASNPCVLAMIPLMMSFVAGRKEAKNGVGQAALFSLVFIVGLAITFTVMGVVAALAGKMYGDVSSVWNWVVALVCVTMGLQLAGFVNIPIPAIGASIQPKTRGFVGAFLLGLLFGLVSAPCAGPMLIVLLTYLAGSGASVALGAMLLLAYALGHSVLILIAGTSMGAARMLLENQKAARALEGLRRVAGVVIVLIGFYFASRAFT